MSLSRLIRNPSAVLERLQADFPRPRLADKPTLVVPSMCDQATTVGTEYDYLLRLHPPPKACCFRWVTRTNPRKTCGRRWVGLSTMPSAPSLDWLRARS